MLNPTLPLPVKGRSTSMIMETCIAVKFFKMERILATVYAIEA